MRKIPFSNVFNPTQSMVVSANAEARVFYGEIPQGYVGFLGVLSSKVYPGVSWSWYIDNECVESNIMDSLGDNTILKPPYVVKKYVEVKAKNPFNQDVALEASCNGVFYEDTKFVPLQLIPLEEIKILKEIKNEMIAKNPKGEVTDELINVTDIVQDVHPSDYEANHGLHWTVCDVVNRGPNNVYIAVNEWKQPVAPLLPGEAQNIDLGKRGSIKKIYLKCDTGQTAQVRFHVLK